MSLSASEQGFTLIEALVALLVLAIAAAGLVRAAEAHIDSIRSVERRAAAQIVAENRLAEIAVGDPAANAPETAMLGQRWSVALSEHPTDDPDLRKVTVNVSTIGDATPMVSLDGFRDVGSMSR